ncbi:uncharacterized protein BDV17DRAFT_30820 [Aspergillus undulatus]|uniref:uncharacterized protein n=1 Tax=Aspergillus undulatus TaxID=1810928 RepID=UPI003CCDCBF8
MAGEVEPYVRLFVSEFKGNHLAIVDSSNVEISHEGQQRIAKEFNFSGTVFLHPNDENNNPRISIFAPENEMELAGDPVIGTGPYLFRQLRAENSETPVSITIMTKAGPVPVSFNPSENVVSANIPHNVHLHQAKATLEHILPVQTSLKKAANLDGVVKGCPVVSIVKGRGPHSGLLCG